MLSVPDSANDTIVSISSHLALLRRGHIDSIFHMFFYLKKHQNSDILFDTTETDIGMDDLQRE